jgi:heme exporter protein A
VSLQVRDLSRGAETSRALSANGLARRYGPTLALRGIDLTLYPGESVALFGPNGAGKTTLIRVLATLLRPNAGSLVVGGHDALRNPSRARRLIGVVGHQTYLYGDLTPAENLRFYGRIYGVADLEDRVSAVLEQVDMLNRADAPVRTLSRGMQQRVSLARAILHEPLVLLLDEPDTGLDDEAQRRLAALIRRWADDGRSVLFASHHIDWAAGVADRAIVLREGRVVSEMGPPLADADGLVSAYRELAELAPTGSGATC